MYVLIASLCCAALPRESSTTTTSRVPGAHKTLIPWVGKIHLQLLALRRALLYIFFSKNKVPFPLFPPNLRVFEH